MKRFFRWMVFAVLAVALVIGLGTLVPRSFLAAEPAETVRPRQILLLSNPIHTDIAIPIDAAVLERFGFLQATGLPTTHPAARWLVFGWGSRAFYISTPTWADLKPGPLAAALTIDRSVMHVLVRGTLDETDASVTSFQLSENRYQDLLEFIATSFANGADGRPVAILGAAYGTDDGFFEANGSFNALLGCNTWTARALRAGGLKTGWWNPLPVTLEWSLVLYNQAPGSQP